MRLNGKTPREILKISSVKEFLDWLPNSLTQLLGLSAFALTALAPLLVSIKAPTYIAPNLYIPKAGKYFISSFYTTDFHEFVCKYVFPYVWLTAVLAYLLTLYKNKENALEKLKNRLLSPTHILFWMLCIWILTNVFLINGPTEYATRMMPPNYENYVVYLEYYLCFFMMGQLVSNQLWKKRLFCFFTFISLTLVPFAVFLYKNVYTDDVISGVFYNSNYYGNYLCVIISLCVSMIAGETSRKEKIFWIAALLINTIVLYFNNTFGAWVGAFFACLFSIAALRIRDSKWKRWPIIAFALFVSCLIVCGWLDQVAWTGNNNFYNNIVVLVQDILNIQIDSASTQADLAGSGRWMIWKYYFSLVCENPCFGIGLEGVMANNLGESIDYARAHNEYLTYATFFGIPGLILYFSTCLSVYTRAIRHRSHLDYLTLAALTSAFGYLVSAFFSNTVYNTTPYLYIMLGLGYVKTKDTKPLPPS